MSARSFFRLFLYVCYVSPWVYWITGAFLGLLGAEPVVKINTQSGYATLILIVINLWLGALVAFSAPFLKKIKWLLQERRSLGIAAGVYALLHFMSYLGKESFLPKAWEQIATKQYLQFGFMAALIVWLLTLTSNNFSTRFMGFKKWKWLHRTVHIASLCILVHILSIEKGNIPLLIAITLPLVLAQVIRGAVNIRQILLKTK